MEEVTLQMNDNHLKKPRVQPDVSHQPSVRFTKFGVNPIIDLGSPLIEFYRWILLILPSKPAPTIIYDNIYGGSTR